MNANLEAVCRIAIECFSMMKYANLPSQENHKVKPFTVSVCLFLCHKTHGYCLQNNLNWLR